MGQGKGHRLVDITGQRFGRLVVLRGRGRKIVGKSTRALWLCLCDCGRDHEVTGFGLRVGGTLSCGCLQSEVTVARNKSMVTHGMSSTSEYRTWRQMISRCTDENAQAYRHYGGRGIGVCPSWMTFANFIADMGLRPTVRHTLEREKNDGNYEPSNCIWATMAVQANNRRNNAIIEHDGRRQNVTQWAREFGIDPERLRDHLRRKSFQRAIKELTA